MNNFISRKINALSVVPVRTHFGYLPFEGRYPNDKTEKYIQRQQIKAINLKPVKRVVFNVDPLHPRSSSIRRLMTLMSSEKITKTGPKTAFKYDFSKKGEPEVTLTFHDNDSKALFKMAYLTEHDMIYEMNKIVLPLVKEESVSVMDLKQQKKKKK